MCILHLFFFKLKFFFFLGRSGIVEDIKKEEWSKILCSQKGMVHENISYAF